jgi:hypothetical protein
VVEKSRVFLHLDSLWQKLLRRPRNYFILPVRLIDEQDFLTACEATMQQRDEHFDTPNNWDSMLYAGLIESSDARTFLLNRINEMWEAGVLDADLFNR